ncbi:hypothetical protein [Desulfoluna butyratoxydans]|uniref:Uncharacterized protein n=1 Tax=Desulfoluna butyratoxydans TaxID=231438 RepID=A0A4U8YNI0_9BACT|nr:hypothetical protein [Desulfoluna butyratoxydans]VFQ45370.1 hypothetical protein MSL71_30270 [Desulfoluna butyratoxydans]
MNSSFNSSLLGHALSWLILGGCVSVFLGVYGVVTYGSLLGIFLAAAVVRQRFCGT